MAIVECVKAILEKMYVGTCDVITHEKVKDEVTKRTAFVDSILYSGIPCRLSYNSTAVAGDGNVADVSMEIKLFLSPEYKIPDGCKMIVTQRGETHTFTNASMPVVYEAHQEVTLKAFERWA